MSTAVVESKPFSKPIEFNLIMKNKRLTEDQIKDIFRGPDSGLKTNDNPQRDNVCDCSYHKWQAEFSSIELVKEKMHRELEAENIRLKRLLIEMMLENASLKDVLSRKM
ncbi:MAG: hypothetical protein HWE24_20085 [Oceanospirillaceae bacterium]|nr:hypothetical protein [Oceanospirillaceae bacterium]